LPGPYAEKKSGLKDARGQRGKRTSGQVKTDEIQRDWPERAEKMAPSAMTSREIPDG